MSYRNFTLFDNSLDDFESRKEELQRDMLPGESISDEDILFDIEEGNDCNWRDLLRSALEYSEETDAYFVVYADIGTWQGRCDGGAIFSSLETAIERCVAAGEYVSVCFEDGELKVEVNHHDGTNYYLIKETTSKGARWAFNNISNFGGVCLKGRNLCQAKMDHLREIKGYLRNVKGSLAEF